MILDPFLDFGQWTSFKQIQLDWKPERENRSHIDSDWVETPFSYKLSQYPLASALETECIRLVPPCVLGSHAGPTVTYSHTHGMWGGKYKWNLCSVTRNCSSSLNVCSQTLVMVLILRSLTINSTLAHDRKKQKAGALTAESIGHDEAQATYTDAL